MKSFAILALTVTILAAAGFGLVDLMINSDASRWEVPDNDEALRAVMLLSDSRLHVLPAGARDPQQPHASNEIYYVVSGRAVMQVGERRVPVERGSTVYVKAGTQHGFRDIAEDLVASTIFTSGSSS